MSRFATVLLVLFVDGLASQQCGSREVSGRLIAIGDLHGDYEKAEAVLKFAGIAERDEGGDGDLHWSGGDTTAVQLGDVFDRGPDSIRLHQLLERLKLEASAAGGELVTLLGNHELMNLGGMLHYVHSGELAAYGGKAAWRALLHPTKGEYGAIIAKYPVTVERGGYVFVHAGYLEKYASLGIEEINRVVLERVARLDFTHHVLTNNGPMWTRSPIMEAMRKQCNLVEGSISAFQERDMAVRGIVVGHTVQGELVKVHCDGKLIGADIGISRYVSGAGNCGYVELFQNGSAPLPRHSLDGVREA